MTRSTFSVRSLLRGGTAGLLIPLLCGSSVLAQNAGQESDEELSRLIAEAAEPLPAITAPEFASFVDRYAEARRCQGDAA